MKVSTLTIKGAKDSEVELPIVFNTPYRKDLIHKVYTKLNTHQFQPKGTPQQQEWMFLQTH